MGRHRWGFVERLSRALLTALLVSPLGIGRAQEGGIVALLPPPPAEADGQTAIVLSYLVLGPDGSPVTGLSGKVVVDGRASVVTETRPGVYEAPWTPTAGDRAYKVPAELHLKGKFKTELVRTDVLEVVPARRSATRPALAIDIDPPLFVLGQDQRAMVTVTSPVTGPSADLEVEVTAGELGPFEPGPDGWVARYDPPPQTFPQVALFAVVHRPLPGDNHAVAVLPLHGNVSFPVVGAPNSDLSIVVGEESFGPVRSDASGKARIPIVVAPGTSEGVVRAGSGATAKEEPLDLRTPDFQRVVLIPSVDAVPADGVTGVPIRAFVVDGKGVPDEHADVTFSATTGKVSAARHEGGGVYTATFVPSLANAVGETTVQVAVSGTGSQGDAMTVRFVPARPGSLQLTASPPRLEGPGPATFTPRVGSTGGEGAPGEGLPGKRLILFLDGATTNGEALDLGGGDYQIQITATKDEVDAVIAAVTEASTNPVSQLLVVPSHDAVDADGTSRVGVLVLGVDRFGYPVTDQTLELTIQNGDGELEQSSVVTDRSGVALLTYRAGTAKALVTLEARSQGGLVATGSFLQIPGGVSPVGNLPVSGAEDRRREQAVWRSNVLGAHYDGEGLTIRRAVAADAPSVVVKESATKSKPERETADVPSLRVLGAWAGGYYNYLQTHQPNAPELWKDSVKWGLLADEWDVNGVEGAYDPAQVGGGSLVARGFLPKARALGAELALRQVFYTVELTGTGAPDHTTAPYADQPLDVQLVAIPRIFHAWGGGVLHGGLRLGGAFQTVAVFHACDTEKLDSCKDYEGDAVKTTVPVWAGSGGVEAGLELASIGGYALASFDVGLKPGQPESGLLYQQLARFGLGVRAVGPLFVGIQLTSQSRQIDIIAEAQSNPDPELDIDEHTAGTVRDRLQTLQAGVGFEL